MFKIRIYSGHVMHNMAWQKVSKKVKVKRSKVKDTR